MVLEDYKNELMILIAAIFLLFGYMYKTKKENSFNSQINQSKHSLKEIKHTAALQDIWENKKTTDKLKKFETLMPKEKTKLTKVNKKIEATYTALSGGELNTLVKTISRLAVEIQKLDITKTGKNYNVGFECKW